MNTLNELLIKLKNNEITCDEALSQLSLSGFCPSIISNDNGQWAVVFDGVQFSAVSEFPEDAIASYYIDKKYWKPTVREALVFAISEQIFESSLDLSKLEQKIDDALKNETKESLTDWINKNRE